MSNNTPMQLTEHEIQKINKANTQSDWYKICDQIKERRNGQYPNYLSREILKLFQSKFPPQIED